MKQTVFKLVFNRKNALQRDGKALVQLYVYRGYKKKFFSTGIYLEPKIWNGIRPNWVKKTNDPNDRQYLIYNKFFLDLLKKLEDIDLEEFSNNRQISDEQIYNAIRGKEKNTSSFIEFMDKTAKQRNDISDGTKRQVSGVINKLKDYNITKFSDLTVENLERLQNSLLKTLKPSRAHKIHSIIKAYLNIAIRRDLFPMDKNPYLKLTIPRGKSEDRKYLTPDELKKIENKEIEIERLQIVKDLFLFSCYTGLSYIDTQNLTKENIINDGDTIFIKTFRQKTEEKSIVYLFDKAYEILKKYDY